MFSRATPLGALLAVDSLQTQLSTTAVLDSVTFDPPAGLGGDVVKSGLNLASGATGTTTFAVTAACTVCAEERASSQVPTCSRDSTA